MRRLFPARGSRPRRGSRAPRCSARGSRPSRRGRSFRTALAPSLYLRRDGVLHRLREFLEPAVDVVAEADTDRATLAAGERLEIADRLRTNENSEREFLARDR